MSISRVARIPLDHVVAELAAFPLATEGALESGVTVLDAQMGASARRLWRSAENALVGSFPSFSLDELVALRDRVWFAETQDEIPLERYLRRLAGWFLEVDGPVAVPRLPSEENLGGTSHLAHTAIARRAWLWLALALPPDLLMAALNRNGRGPERIDLLSPPLARQLFERHYAETHLHVGAAIDFPLLWNLVLRSLATPELKENAFCSAGAVFSEGAGFCPWLVRAALARYILAAYLCWRREGGFIDYLESDFQEIVARSLGAAGFSRLITALNELGRGRLTNSPATQFGDLKEIYAELTAVRTVAMPSSLALAVNADPLNALLPAENSLRTPEVRFVSRALRRLEENRRRRQDDPVFAKLFWQTVRVRSMLYRHVVQRPLTPGLQWFVRVYGRASPARRNLSTATLLESAGRLGGVGAGLRSLEIRTSPVASISRNSDYVSEIDRVAARWHQQGVELGLVFHFIKRREGGADSGHPRANWSGSNADPRLSDSDGNPTGYRYARYFRQRRQEAQALAWLLCHRPLSLQVVRGVDVCTDELGVPNWVMVPLLTRVRQAAADGAHALQRLCGWAPPPLRATAHAGEEFTHLLTGLRSVDEAIEQFGLREGDRIGHGLALGIEPRSWAARAGRIAMLIEERLFDLVWEWNWYGEQGGDHSRDRSLFLGFEIARLSAAMFGGPIPPYELVLLRQELCNPDYLRAAGFPDGPPPAFDPRSRRGLLPSYLTDSIIFQNSRQVIWVDPSGEGEFLAALQSALRRKLGGRGITVEVNPTSNLLIGDLSDLTAHPLWRLNPPRGDGDAPPVSICVGSDDPLVFNSSLPNEYQFLSDALALAGLSNEEARQWLDRTRACGLDHRFTVPRRTADPITSLFNSDPPRPLSL